MTSRIKHLQHAKVYPFTRVTNTKSMTPNQLRSRASGFKSFRVSRQIVTTFIFLYFFCFFFSFLEDYIGVHIWVTQTYYGISTGLRPALQSERRYKISQPIGTIWSAVCQLPQGGMFKLNTLKHQLTKN